jgi:mono/diheme cytochrome c family protein
MMIFKPLTVPLILLCGMFAAWVSLPAHALTKAQKIKAGATLYQTKGCGYCHGKTATGTAKGPSLTHLGWWRWRGSRQARQINNGGQKMPAFGDSLTSNEVSELVAWLRSHPGAKSRE